MHSACALPLPLLLMHNLPKLVISHVHTKREVETSVAPVHQLELAKLDKVGVFGVPFGHNAVHLVLQLDLLRMLVGRIPLGHASLALGEGDP